jgi:DNA-binding response OmpR family regulator
MPVGAATAPERAPGQRTMPQRRVLVVEDDHDLAEMMSWVLIAAGFEVTTAHNGAAGLAALERLPHSIVILDLMMPDVDGVEFRARQRQHPVACRTPVLVVSAHHKAEQLAAEMQVEGYLPKPFSPDALVSAVSRIMTAAS